MVRIKNLPKKTPEPGTSEHNIVGELIVHCAAAFYRNMAISKCHACELKMNGLEERRPGIKCKQCKMEHCFKCAEMTVEVCEVVRGITKGFWTCNDCETKSADMKAVLESMKSIKTELCTIKEGQAEQQAEREQVIEGLKTVKEVAKKLERIEVVQEAHEQRLSTHDEAIKKNSQRVEETESRMTSMEKRMEKVSSDEHANVKLTNAVIREMYNLEKVERNIIIANVPESKEEEAAARKKEDERRVNDVLKDLHVDHVKPVNVIRVGFQGRYPRKVKVILSNAEEGRSVLGNAEKTKLPNDIWLARDRTWNQREEARLFREEKEKEEAQGAVPKPKRGRPPGSGKGPAIAKNMGSVRGRGSGSANRKRHRSSEEEENKWRKTGETGRGGGGGGGRGLPRGRGAEPLEASASPSNLNKEPEDATPTQQPRASGRPGTPVPRPSFSTRGAAGGSEQNF